MKNYVLGIDFGSDSVRCLVVDADNGKQIGSAVVFYPRWKNGEFCNPSASQYRQHPSDHIESLEKCIKEALACTPEGTAGRVCGISFDTTASTPVLTDIEGVPLALLEKYKDNPDAMFILWKDHTAIEEADRINEVAHRWHTDYTRYSGGTYSCEWVWAKMLHCLKSSPQLQQDCAGWVEHGDWISGVLTGNTRPETIVRSRCIAGHKAMWNEKWGGLPDWDFLTEVDPLLGIFKGHLFSETRTSDKKAGGLCREWAQRLGLKEGISVGVAAIDCHVGAVGAGIEPGTLVKVMGTSTCDIATCSYESIADRQIKGICGQVDGSVLPGQIGLEAGQAAFGDIYAWFRRFSGQDLSSLTEEACKLEVTEDDPIAIDWFNGRRTPDADPRKKGTITGLTLATTPAQFFKALVEATAFGSRAINERLEEEGVPIKKIIAVGGITKKSKFVMNTMANVLGLPVEVPDTDQACALGAAMFAACGAGIYSDIHTAQEKMKPGITEVYLPDTEKRGIYDILYRKYKRLGNCPEL